MIRVLFLIFTMLTASWPLSTADAHEVRPAVADVTVNDREVRMAIRLTLEPIIAGMSLAGLENTNDSPLAGRHDTLRKLPPEALEAEFMKIWPSFRDRLVLESDGERITPELVSISIPEVGDIELPRDATLVVSAQLPVGQDPAVAGWDPSLGALALRQQSGDQVYGKLLEPGDLSDPLPRIGIANQTAWQTILHYAIAGFDHIVPKGLDHILFVLGLFFFASGWRPLLWQVSAFTLAHTITLALATLKIVTVSPAIVEPLIAASIAYIAIENIFGSGVINIRRVLVIFAFGLLHGLGFASVLGDFGLEQGRFILSLIAFNMGVEFGQIAVLLGAWMLVGIWFNDRKWYRPFIAVPASAAIGLVGLWWAVERTLL